MATTETLDIQVNLVDDASSALKDLKDNFDDTFEDAINASEKFAIAIAAAGVAVAAFATKAVLSFSDTGDAIEKMAERTGLSAEAVSGLKVAADMAGTSIESVESGIKLMQKSMQAADDGTVQLTTDMEAFGISVNDDFFALDPAGQFEYLAQQIGALEDPAARTQAAMAAFGKSGADLIPLFEDGSFSMQEWEDQAKLLGVSFDDMSAGSAAQLNDALGTLKLAASGLAIQVGEELAPYIIAAVDAFTAWLESMGGISGVIDSIKASFAAIEPYLPIIAGAITGALVPAMISLGLAAIEATVAFAAGAIALAPWIALGAAVGLAIYGVIYVIQNWGDVVDWIKEKLGAAWDWISEKTTTVFTTISDTITTILGGIYDYIAGVFDMLIAETVLFAELFFLPITLALMLMDTDWKAVWTGISDFLMETLAVIQGLIETVFIYISDFFVTIWDGVVSTVTSTWETIKTLFTNGLSALQTGWTNTWTAIGDFVVGIWENVKTTIGDSINWVIEKINGLIAGVNAVSSKVGISSIPSIPAVTFAQGGVVPNTIDFSPQGTDTVPALLTPGERVLTRQQNQQYESGGMGGITININNPMVLDDADIVAKIGDPIIRELMNHSFAN